MYFYDDGIQWILMYKGGGEKKKKKKKKKSNSRMKILIIINFTVILKNHNIKTFFYILNIYKEE